MDHGARSTRPCVPSHHAGDVTGLAVPIRVADRYGVLVVWVLRSVHESHRASWGEVCSKQVLRVMPRTGYPREPHSPFRQRTSTLGGQPAAALRPGEPNDIERRHRRLRGGLDRVANCRLSPTANFALNHDPRAETVHDFHRVFEQLG